MRTRRPRGLLAGVMRLSRDQRGAIMMILGLIAIPLFAAIGLAVDLGRGYMLRSKLSYAIDAAGLAGGRAFESDLREDDILMFFEANFPTGYMGSVLKDGKPTIVFHDEENTIEILATATIPTRFMSVAGVYDMTVSARSLIQRELRGMELVLVMDNTGSMRSGGKMDAMKNAATELVSILYGSREEIPQFWVALVPYAAQVNVGSDRTDWLVQQSFDPDAPWQNTDPDNLERYGYHPDHYLPTSWKGCVEAREYPRDSNDDPPSVQKWYPYLWRTVLRRFENPHWTYPSTQYVVVVKSSSTSYTNSSNVIYSQGAPSPSQPTPTVVQYSQSNPGTWGRWLNGDNDWNPDGPQSALKEANSAENEGTGPNLGCGPAITPLVASRSTIQAGIDEMLPWHRGGTFANLGLAWGWRVLSPRWRDLWGGDTPAGLPLDYSEPNMEKVVILLTDGQNQWFDYPGTTFKWGGSGDNHYTGLPGGNAYPTSPSNYRSQFQSAWPGADYTAYGRLSEGRLGTTNNGTAKTKINQRMLELCTAMKAEGILMYTITFQENDTATQNLYRDCASDPKKYFNSPSNSDLQQAFVQIANELSNLRIAE